MADDGFYEDDDQRRAALLQGVINPIASSGGNPDQYRGQVQLPNGGAVSSTGDPGQPGSPSYSGPKLIPRNAAVSPEPTSTPPPAAGATVPAATSPSGSPQGPPKTWPAYARDAMAKQYESAQAADKTTKALASQPDEATVIAPLQAKSAALGQPLDPRAQEYKPGIGQKILRGVKGVATGIAEGGVFGGLVGGLDTDYKAPNRQYGIDTAQRGAQKAVVDQQISAAQKAYEDATKRATSQAQEQRATAGTFNDVVGGAVKQEDAEKPEKLPEGERPLGSTVPNLNKAMADRYQVLNPGKPLPAQYVLPADATQKDYDRVDKALAGVETAQGTQAQRAQVNAMREQAMAATEAARGANSSVALDRESKQFSSGWEKENTAADTQLEKIADARAMVNGSAESQALGIPKVLTALVGGQGTGVRITTPELNAIAHARGIQGDVEGWLNKASGKGSLTKTQQQQLTQILDDVKQRITQKQAIASEALDGIYNGATRQDIIKAHETGRQKLSDFESGETRTYQGHTYQKGGDGQWHLQ